MKEFFELFLGTTLLTFLVFLAFAYLGAIINLCIDLLERDPKSDTSPKKFNIKYWWADNKIRLFIVFVLIPIALLLSKDLFGLALSNTTAFFIGFSNDSIIRLIKKRKFKEPNVHNFEEVHK